MEIAISTARTRQSLPNRVSVSTFQMPPCHPHLKRLARQPACEHVVGPARRTRPDWLGYEQHEEMAERTAGL
jgi:hypothetical protein